MFVRQENGWLEPLPRRLGCGRRRRHRIGNALLANLPDRNAHPNNRQDYPQHNGCQHKPRPAISRRRRNVVFISHAAQSSHVLAISRNAFQIRRHTRLVFDAAVISALWLTCDHGPIHFACRLRNNSHQKSFTVVHSRNTPHENFHRRSG